MEAPLNRVEAAGLRTIDLTQLLPLPPVRPLDLAQFLEEGLVLREKAFRTALAQHDWKAYQDALVPIFVSTEAIVPPWAFLLVGMYLAPYARYYGVGPPEAVIERYQLLQFQELPLEPFRDQKILLKGCANLSPAILTEFFRRVMPVARLVFYGEACSSVPIYKRK
ncbi:MAG: DUF2480 family protein [Bacteroidia bacterium]|nr:DUF2480 family protein [Bacteroidia bacterium]MDW8089083.1 DUF2480 family protein [Bacteroidia bacterium]